MAAASNRPLRHLWPTAGRALQWHVALPETRELCKVQRASPAHWHAPLDRTGLALALNQSSWHCTQEPCTISLAWLLLLCGPRHWAGPAPAIMCLVCHLGSPLHAAGPTQWHMGRRRQKLAQTDGMQAMRRQEPAQPNGARLLCVVPGAPNHGRRRSCTA